MRPPFFLTCILILISTFTSIAQPPEQFTYQAVIRDSNNLIIRNTTIGLRLSVLKDSSTSTTPLYSETHTLSTNGNGLITTEIGGGTVESGNFSGIIWGDGIYFIKTEIDVDGGMDYGISGVTRVLSVPYALYSKRSQYSDTSGVTVYSDSARVTSYSQTSGTSSYSDSSRVSFKSNVSDSSGYSIFSDSSRTSGFTQTSLTSGYSDSSGVSGRSDLSVSSLYSDSTRISGSSIYTDSSRVSGYSDTSSFSLTSGYSDSSRIAAYTDSSGVSGYSDSTRIANTSAYSLSSNYSDSSRISGFTQTSLTSGYSDSSRVTNTATYSDSARISGSSVYSDSSRLSGYSDTSSYSIKSSSSDSSRFAIYSDTSDVSGYSDSTRIADTSAYSLTSIYSDSSRVTKTATYSDSARITNYSDSARVSVQSDSSVVSNRSNYSDSARVARLLPRMTASQRDSMQSPPEGLQIYNLTTHCLELNMGSPTSPEWFQIGCLGTVDSLLCDSAVISQGLTVKTPTDGRTVTIPYTNGNSYDYPQKEFQSQGVSGLTLSLLKGRVNSGDGDISMEFYGTPQDTGKALFLIDVVTKSCSLGVYVDVARVDSLICGLIISNKIFEGDSVDSISIQLSYKGGNGGYFFGDTIESTEILGMTAIIDSGYLGIGDDSIQINLKGVPMGNGVGYFPISIGGQTCSLGIIVIDSSVVYYPAGYVHCFENGDTTDIVPVLNPITNKVWMDRNLGASRVPQTSTDAQGYGDLFQWGRFADGHQCRNSDTTSTNATTTVPSAGNAWDGKFIVEKSYPYDWLIPQNNNIWQGVDGINNPCPIGYRVPNEAEWEVERQSWGSNNLGGAFGSPLRLQLVGWRDSGGELVSIGNQGYYWSSSVSVSYSYTARYLFVSNVSNNSGTGYMSSYIRVSGLAVRCIKD